VREMAKMLIFPALHKERKSLCNAMKRQQFNKPAMQAKEDKKMARIIDEICVISVFKGSNKLTVVSDGKIEEYETESFAFPKIKEAAKAFISKHFPELHNVKFSVDRRNNNNDTHFSTWLGGSKFNFKRVIL